LRNFEWNFEWNSTQTKNHLTNGVNTSRRFQAMNTVRLSPCALHCLRYEIHQITSRALFTSNSTDTSDDFLDTFYTQLFNTWPTTREAWMKCLSTNIAEQTLKDMKNTALQIATPEPFQSSLPRAHPCEKDCGSHASCALLAYATVVRVVPDSVDRYFAPSKAAKARSSDEVFNSNDAVAALDAIYASKPTCFLSAQRYGPYISPLLKDQPDEQSILHHLRHFVQHVCAAEVFLTVCVQMDLLSKGTIYSSPVWACVCCTEREVCVLFRPCRHRCLCAPCYDTFRQMCNDACPICRSPIQNAMRSRRSGDVSVYFWCQW